MSAQMVVVWCVRVVVWCVLLCVAAYWIYLGGSIVVGVWQVGDQMGWCTPAHCDRR